MNRMMKVGVAVLASAWGTIAVAQSAPTIQVTPYLALNAFGSPNYSAEIANQNYALENGLSSAGTPGTASYYQAQSAINTTDLIVTNFNSYRGTANPSGVYSSELGTRAALGLYINGNGAQFSISSLSLNVVGSGNSGTPDGGDYDMTPYLDFSRAAGSYNYGDGYVGILFGTNGGADTFITSGPNTQLVDALVGRGSGTAYSVTCGTSGADFGPCGADNQSYIDAAADGYPFPKTYTGTYSLNGAIGSGAFTVSAPSVAAAAPEAATWTMMLVGFGLAGVTLRRRAMAGRGALRLAGSPA